MYSVQQHSLLDPSHPVRNILLVLLGYREETTALSDPIKLHCQDMPIIIMAQAKSVCVVTRKTSERNGQTRVQLRQQGRIKGHYEGKMRD